ncbi:MAG: DUF4292 domain-containing protein [Proteobacteria bacterium]|nr:DUF4292 domain-containing protein [Pseudomonadota bacterium]
MISAICWRRGWLVFLIVVGCASRGVKPAANVAPESVLEMARARPVPATLQSRFNIKIRSKLLEVAGSTGGGLFTDRPGKGYLAILGPLGSPLLTVASDGQGLAATIPKNERYLVAEDAEAVLQEATGGVAGMDDVLALLVGDLPFDEAKVKSKKRLGDGLVLITFAGPSKTTVEAVLDGATGTPRQIVALGPKGQPVLTATYEPFADRDGNLMPTQVEMLVPDLDLKVELKYKTWKVLEEAPDVFVLQAPDGYETESLEDSVLKQVDEFVEQKK